MAPRPSEMMHFKSGIINAFHWLKSNVIRPMGEELGGDFQVTVGNLADWVVSNQEGIRSAMRIGRFAEIAIDEDIMLQVFIICLPFGF